jgi:tetratricopeptide (TPR) repeat protein
MKKLITLSAMALLAVARLCMAQDSTKADKYAFPPLPQELKHADSLLTAGDSTQGLAVLRSIIDSKVVVEVKAMAYYNMAKFYEANRSKTRNGRVSYRYRISAYNAYKTIVSNDEYRSSPIMPWAVFSLALLSPWEEEKVLLERFVAEYSGYELVKEAYKCLARDYRDNREYDRSITLWGKIQKEYPDDRWLCSEAMYNIARFGPEQEKEAILREIIKEYPDQEHWCLYAYDEIAGDYGQKGDKNSAIRVIKESITKFPNHGSVPGRWSSIYHAYNDLKEYEKAKEIKEMILRLYPDSYEAFTLDPNKKK